MVSESNMPVAIVLTCLIILVIILALWAGWFYSPKGQVWWLSKRYGGGVTEVFLDWFQQKRV